MEERIMSIKSLGAGWRKETIQMQYPIWNCSWLQWKWKIISVMDTSIKCEKGKVEWSIMLETFYVPGWGGKYYIWEKCFSCLELFITTMIKKQYSEWKKYVNNMEPKKVRIQ